MLKSNRRKYCVGLFSIALVAGRLNGADWAVNSPDSSDQYVNNVQIQVDGDKPDTAMGNAYLRREINQVWTTVTNPSPINNQGENWSALFTPPPGNWTNGDYQGYVKNMAGTDSAEGELFTVVDP